MSRKTSKNNATAEKQQFTVVIPAAGVGSRMQADRPKQYLILGESTVLEQTINRLIGHPQISRIVLAVNPEDEYLSESTLAEKDWLTITHGGTERSDSVLNGIRQVEEDWVLVHDAARPCVRHNDIRRLLQLAEEKEGSGGILARKATDTIKQAKGTLQTREISNDSEAEIQKSVPRHLIWHALTPQFFPTRQLAEALTWCAENSQPITDEASAIELTGGKAHLIPGSADNIKITHPGDLALAEFFLAQQALEISSPAK